MAARERERKISLEIYLSRKAFLQKSEGMALQRGFITEGTTGIETPQADTVADIYSLYSQGAGKPCRAYLAYLIKRS